MKKGKTTQHKQLLQPLHDKVLIQEQSEEKETTTKSGIIIPMNSQEDKGSKRGKVAAVGTGIREDGKLIPLSVKIGDEVLFQWGDKIKFNDQEYYLVKESEILAIIK